MTKTEARKWLKAVRGLAAYYRGENDLYSNYDGRDYYCRCPLCPIVDGNCDKCLWMLFSKTPCFRYATKYFGDIECSELRANRNPRWVKLSLKRLARWEKRLIKIIDG